MKIRQVTLCEGPHDGLKSVASHNTAVCSGEIYVWDGGADPDHFVHALTAIGKMSEVEREKEKAAMKTWTTDPHERSVPAEIPQWRFFAWLELLRYGAVE